MDETQALLSAQQAIRLNDKATAIRLLYQAIKANPRSQTAWLWLSALVDDPVKERECLERVVKINPDNEIAQKHLARLAQVEAPTPQPAPQPTVERLTTCPHCGESIKASVGFCSYCGQNMQTGTESESPLSPKVGAPSLSIAQQSPSSSPQPAQKKRKGKLSMALGLVALVSLVSLVCCAWVLWAPYNRANEQTIPTPTKSRRSEADYLLSFIEINDRYSSANTILGLRITIAGENPSLFFDSQWKRETRELIRTIKACDASVRALQPPSLFAGVHRDYLIASGHSVNAADLLDSFLDDYDVSKLDKAKEETDLAAQWLVRAIAKMDGLVEALQ